MGSMARHGVGSWLNRSLLAATLWLAAFSAFAGALEIKSLALTVSDLDRSVAFHEKALDFRKISERVLVGRDYDYLTGVYGSRVKSATLQLGNETIELDQYLSPEGNPIPTDSRSNDAWFQHFAVVVSDMDQAHEHLKGTPFQAISSAPQTIPASSAAAAGCSLASITRRSRWGTRSAGLPAIAICWGSPSVAAASIPDALRNNSTTPSAQWSG